MDDQTTDGSEDQDALNQLPIVNAEEHLQQLVDTALDAVITCDTRSHITVWNNGATRLFGWTPEEAIGRTLTETIIPSEYREAHARGMERFLKTGEGPVLGQRIEINAVDRAGRIFPVELSINPIRTKDGLGFSGFIREITDRIEADRRIREGEERLQLIIDSADEGIWDYQFDESGAVTESFVSDRTTDLLGDRAGLIPPERAVALPEERDAIRRAWDLHWNNVEETFLFEYRIPSPGSKETIWLRERGTIVQRDEEGRPRRAVGSVVDISTRKKLQRTLLMAQKGEALGLVAGGFAHDLNNVLSIVRGNASILRHDTSLSPSIIDSLNDIELAVDRASTLIHNMLQLGRPKQGQHKETKVNGLIRETLELIRPAIPRSVQLSGRYELDDEDSVYLDPEQLQQAMLNLLLNARDAMDQGGDLLITSSSRVNARGIRRGVIQVLDSGCGIPPERLDAVFEPFYTTKGKDGTGLGLATVKNFVEDCGGSVLIDSRIGIGTTIELELPLWMPDTNVTGATSSNASSDSHSVRQAKILLAEDHDMLRPMLTSNLIQAGHDVKPVASVAEGLASGLQSQPDLMVMDIDLIGGSGLDLAGDIRAHWKVDIPVVFITGNCNHDVKQDAVTVLLKKPFDINVLKQMINALLHDTP